MIFIYSDTNEYGITEYVLWVKGNKKRFKTIEALTDFIKSVFE